MKVSELIAELKGMNQDAEVHFSYNYGDYWRTRVAPVAECVEEGMVKLESRYDMPTVIDTFDDDYDDTKAEANVKAGKYADVVIISA